MPIGWWYLEIPKWEGIQIGSERSRDTISPPDPETAASLWIQIPPRFERVRWEVTQQVWRVL